MYPLGGYLLSCHHLARRTFFLFYLRGDKMRTVLKFHGKALPRMRRILLADGLVELAVEAKADAAGAETEAVQVSVSEDTDREEPDEYYND